MQDFSAFIATSSDCESILEYVYEECKAMGAIRFRYHFTPVFESQTSNSVFVWTRDYPAEFEKAYVEGTRRASDPVPRLTFEFGPFLTWSNARHFGQGDETAEQYFLDALERGSINWVSFALFGHRNRDAFGVVTFNSDPDEFEEGILVYIQSLLQTAHLQICKIMDEDEREVILSDREREVLEWIGRGKSSAEIATILSISAETVRTYTRRIYKKLGTNDRVTATVRALKLGIVEL